MKHRLLDELDGWKSRFDPTGRIPLEKLLAEAVKFHPHDAASLIRMHEALLFLRAYPLSAETARLADRVLFSFASRIEEVCRDGRTEAFAEPDVSGMAGTSFSAVFSYEVARRLSARHGGALTMNWESFDAGDLGPVLSRLLPIFGEDWPVEANVPYATWMKRARRAGVGDLQWLLEQLDRLPAADREKAALYESLHLPVNWELANSRATRSRARLPRAKLFYHRAPLVQRTEVSLTSELNAAPLPVRRLSRGDARRVLDLILDTSAVRYRELYGFTYPDDRHVLQAEMGRGVKTFFFGVPPERRLPVRAYHCGMFFKNGVPIGYVEMLSLCERAEMGFNIYYTFREGESVWLYAKTLRLCRQLLGVTCFSVDPYQIGHHNEEAIDSGAFWFYRKLGFRPVRPEAARLLEREEARLRSDPRYRTPRPTLRRLAAGCMIFELPGQQTGVWDRFEARNLGFATSREMARHFDGDAGKLSREATKRVSRLLQMDSTGDLAVVLSLIPDLGRWTPDQRAALAAIVRAKHGPDERRYLRLTQRHERLRQALLTMGSS